MYRKFCITFLLISAIFLLSGVLYAGELLSGVYNRPNPFTPPEEETEIVYTLGEAADVEIAIYTLVGNLVRKYSMQSGESGARAGQNTKKWDGRNGDTRLVATGAYIVVITATTSSVAETKIRKIGVFK